MIENLTTKVDLQSHNPPKQYPLLEHSKINNHNESRIVLQRKRVSNVIRKDMLQNVVKQKIRVSSVSLIWRSCKCNKILIQEMLPSNYMIN